MRLPFLLSEAILGKCRRHEQGISTFRQPLGKNATTLGADSVGTVKMRLSIKKSSTGLFAGAGLLGGGRESDCRHTDYRIGGWSDGRTADGRDGSVVQSVSVRTVGAVVLR